MADAATTPSPWKGAFAVTLVFALGAIFGAALCVVLLRSQAFPHRIGPRGGGPGDPAGFARMSRELDLDADQRERIHAILERTHADVRKALDLAHREIRTVLRADQQEKFDRMRPRGPSLRHERTPPPL